MNENQIILFNWLIETCELELYMPAPFDLIKIIVGNMEVGMHVRERQTLNELTVKEQFEFLQAFAEWGLSKED